MSKQLMELRQTLTKHLPGSFRAKMKLQSHCKFWSCVILALTFISLILLSIGWVCLDRFILEPLYPHLSFDRFYREIIQKPIPNIWKEMTSTHRWDILRRNKIFKFPFGLNVFQVNYKGFCIQRDKYMFELLNIFHINTHKEKLSEPRVLVIGSHTSLGNLILKTLKTQNILTMHTNSSSFLNFKHSELRKVLSYVKITAVFVCDSAPSFRFTTEDDTKYLQNEHESFADGLMSWAKENNVKVFYPKLPYRSYLENKIKKDGYIVDFPFFLDPSHQNDRHNIILHTISECQLSHFSTVDAYSNSSFTTKDLTAQIIDMYKNPKSKIINGEYSLNDILGSIASQFKCNITYERGDKVEPNNKTFDFLNDLKYRKPEKPYLSFVIVGRHDGFSKGFENRSQNFINAIANNSIKVPMANFEIVYVDYATPSEKLPLSAVMNIPPSLHGKVRFIEVPVSTHTKLVKRLNASVSFFEYIAKNIGVRRSRGDFILTTNPDDLFSPDFLADIEAEGFSSGILYRASRWSGHQNTSSKFSPEELVGALSSPWRLKDFEVKARCTADISGSAWFTTVETMKQNAYPCGAGDFLMLSAEMWEASGGFTEFPGNANVDALFLAKLMKIVPGYVREVVRPPIIHQYHPRKNIFRPSVRNHENMMTEYACSASCPMLGRFQETPDWGLPDDKFKEVTF